MPVMETSLFLYILKSLTKIYQNFVLNYVAFTCTSASDNGGCQPSLRDGSDGGHGRFELNPLFGISTADAWASSS